MVEYSFQWDVEVKILGVLLFLVENMGGMNHLPLAQIKTSNVHQNGAHSPVCTFHIFSHEKKLVSSYDFVPLSFGINPNFITIPHLCGSWLNLSEFRGGFVFCSKG